MTRSRTRLLPALAALAALTLGACGANEPSTPEPITVTTSAVSPVATTSPSPSASPSASASSGGTVRDATASLTVQDQQGDGLSVVAAAIRINEANAYLAIYAGNALLGSADVASNNRTASVKLEQPITKTGQYRAVLFGERENGSFDPQTDPRIVGADGKPVSVTFRYTVR